jgi:hypothetical protein
MLELTNNDRLNHLTDLYHDAVCKRNHTDQCAYNYGNWTDDVRDDMLVWKQKVQKIVNRFGLVTAARMITDVAHGEIVKQNLQDFLDGQH